MKRFSYFSKPIKACDCPESGIGSSAFTRKVDKRSLCGLFVLL